MKSGNLNFLEPSGPLQACNGTALPFFTYILRNVAAGRAMEPGGDRAVDAWYRIETRKMIQKCKRLMENVQVWLTDRLTTNCMDRNPS